MKTENTGYIYLIKDNTSENAKTKFIKTEIEATEEWLRVFNERYSKGADYNFTYSTFLEFKDWKNIPNKELVKSVGKTIFTNKIN